MEELAIDLLHIEFLRLAVIHREEVVELRRRLIEVEGELLLFVVLGFEVVGAATALVGAARAPLGVHGACIAMRRYQIVDLRLHIRIDVQFLAKKVLAESQALKELVARMRRRVAAILLLRFVGLRALRDSVVLVSVPVAGATSVAVGSQLGHATLP